jgi:MFS family permease
MNNKVSYFALLIVAPITVMTGSVLSASLPLISEHFQYVENAKLLSQLILTIPFIAITFFGPFVHYLTDIFGKQNTFILALVYTALVGALTGILDNIYLILVARFLFGFGIATISSIFLSIIGDSFDGNERNTFLGYQSSFVFLAGAIFTMLGAWAGEYSWRYCFYLYLLIILLVFTSKFFLRTTIQAKPIKKIKIFNFKLFKEYFLIFFFAFFLKLLFFIFPTQLPFLLVEIELETHIGIILAFLLFFAIFSSFIFGYLNKKISLKSLLIISLLLKAISYIGLAISSSLYPFLFVTAFSGISSGLLHILLVKWLLDQISISNRLEGSGLLTSSMHCGFFFSPIFFYPFVNSFGIISSFLIAAACLIMASFYLHVKMK